MTSPTSAHSSPLRPLVQQRSLRQQITAALRDEMMTGRLPAGTRFTVKEIADLYGVSATPVREALVDLTSQALLWMEHNRGFRVPLFTWETYTEIVDARSLVTDGFFGRIDAGTQRVDLGSLPAIRRRAQDAQRAARAGQLDILVGCDRRFWLSLGELLANRRLTDYLDWLRVQYWIFAAPYLRGRADIARYCWDRHLELVDLVEARDVAGVREMLHSYNQESLAQMAELCGEPTVPPQRTVED